MKQSQYTTILIILGFIASITFIDSTTNTKLLTLQQERQQMMLEHDEQRKRQTMQEAGKIVFMPEWREM